MTTEEVVTTEPEDRPDTAEFPHSADGDGEFVEVDVTQVSVHEMYQLLLTERDELLERIDDLEERLERRPEIEEYARKYVFLNENAQVHDEVVAAEMAYNKLKAALNA